MENLYECDSYAKLYECLENTELEDFYAIESDFFIKFLTDVPAETMLPCIRAYITISKWMGASLRDGVWTFYEEEKKCNIDVTIDYLKKIKEEELLEKFQSGIRDYQNPKYEKECDYPEEWLEESELLDAWILEHEEWIWQWQRTLLEDNKEVIMALGE